MTPPDPLPPHILAAQQRILTAAEKHALTPADRLVLLRNALGNYRRDRVHTISDRQLAALLLDVVDVVEQLAEQAGPTVEYALLVNHEDGSAPEYVHAEDPSHAEQMAQTIYRGRPSWTVGREPEGPWRYVRRGAVALTGQVAT